MQQRMDEALPAKARLVGLDLLRLAAVVFVLGRHMPLPPESWPLAGRLPLLVWCRGGWVGVDLFFVLSGFLVSGLLFNEFKTRGSLGVGRFYMRRGWKIYPPFIVLIVSTIVVRWLHGMPISTRAVVSELFFLQSYIPGLWIHTWSLAVEEHFYILLPLVLACILRFNRAAASPLRPVLWVAGVVAVVSLGLRIATCWLRPSYNNYVHLFASHLRLDSLLFGVAISYVYWFHTERFTRLLAPWRRELIGCGALLLLPAFLLSLPRTPFLYTVGLSVFTVGSGMLLVGVLLTPVPSHRHVAGLAALGAFSYSIYLWHMPVLRWGVPAIESLLGGSLGFGAKLLTYFSGSFLVGVLMAQVVEVPVLRLRDRWFPSRAAGAGKA